MCLSAGAMMALSAAGTVASMFMQNKAQQSAMKDYNSQVGRQNKLLQDQFQDRQKKIGEARTQQGRTFKTMADAQDAEFARQKELAAKKQQVFEQAAQKPVNVGAESPEFQQAVDRREQMFKEVGVTPDFAPMGADTAENRVLRSSAEKANLKEKTKTDGMIGALNKMGAMGDTEQKQGQLFRDLTVGLGDVAQDAKAGSRALEYKLRNPEYRMGALSNVMGEQANMPYFRGREPQYQQPNTLFADILGGASQLGGMYAFHQPAGTGGKLFANPWVHG